MDRDKVIKGLEHCIKHDGYECQKCPYLNDECLDDLMFDALALLKENEKKEKHSWKRIFNRMKG